MRLIGATFCGKTGEAEAVEGTLMAVTCAACQKVTDPDMRRYRNVTVPLTLGTDLIHGGGVINDKSLRRLLHALTNDVFQCVFDPDASAAIVGLITGEMQKLDPDEEEES